ncbi:MAG: 3-methyl-2-oxobutanoate hydroxymethyltransferase [Verrucomicrobia bacterium]|nr:3-methyl-2-oxobutanoate hydroxymethyltransferase [Verrucomicrobiota bacterium]MBR5606501.1 3-methyl-2-oxobutanoate hydroxymethyltransferase [Verrucomicrobiota bacterium]MBR5737448.1 3-methyl-2-oxobutanoate hydroxymethyltransferase [Verrucomicrobiota bacterium]
MTRESFIELRSRFLNWKAEGKKIASLTAYDYPTARLLDEAGVDFLLIGDSLGMVVLGYPDTIDVTVEDMVHHTKAVARGCKRAVVIADMPYKSYETPQQAVETAKRLEDAGAQCVKLEGGRAILPQIEAILNANIPILAHLGMLPQHVREEGGYHIKGKVEAEQKALLEDALALEKVGVLGTVLELVKHDLAGEISRALKIPTIGIGAGSNCDGQILVTHDLIGYFPWFVPKHVKQILHIGENIREGVRKWVEELKRS